MSVIKDQSQFIQEFVATLSHEFRTPLASLMASIELFGDDAAHLSRQETQELLKTVRLSVTNLHTLVDNLLDNASIQAHQLTIKPQQEALPQLVAEAIQIMQPLLDRRQQTFSYHSPLYLPPVLADASRIRQVLVNLMMNASKYSPPKSTLEVSLHLHPTHLQLQIADRGSGILAEQLDQLFAPFTRLESSSEVRGLGLGLAVVKAIVEAHQGEVTAHPRDEGGSVFGFSLPRVS